MNLQFPRELTATPRSGALPLNTVLTFRATNDAPLVVDVIYRILEHADEVINAAFDLPGGPAKVLRTNGVNLGVTAVSVRQPVRLILAGAGAAPAVVVVAASLVTPGAVDDTPCLDRTVVSVRIDDGATP